MIHPVGWRWRARRLAKDLSQRASHAALGDLVEEYAARAAARGRWRAEIWLLGEMASLRRAYRLDAGRRRWLVRRGELTQTLRALGRAPWYFVTLAGVMAVSLALGATVFAITDGALFKPLPYAGGDRFFAVTLGHSTLPDRGLVPFAPISPSELHAWRAALPDALVTGVSGVGTQTVGFHANVRAARIDPSFFDVIGIHPAAGGFSAADFMSTGPVPPAIVTDAFWRARLGGDAAAIGRTLLDDTGAGIRVVGILPREFLFPLPAGRDFMPEVLTPLVEHLPLETGNYLHVLVRLKSVGHAADAAATLTAAARTWAATQPPLTFGPNISGRNRLLSAPYDIAGLMPLREALIGPVAPRARMVLSLAAALLLLACLNFAGLAIARIRDRAHDLVLRRSLGARTSDLLRLLAVEHTIVVAAGTVVGLALGYPLLRATLALIGSDFLVVIKPVSIDHRVIVFIALAAAGCIGCVSALSAVAAVRASGRTALGQPARGAARRSGTFAVIALEIAVAFVVVSGAALVAASLVRARNEDPGFDEARTALLTVQAPLGATAADIEMLITAIGRVPGVAAAGAAAHSVLAHGFSGSVFDAPPGIADRPVGGGAPIQSIPMTHGYLEAAGFHPLDGRFPTDDELLTGAPVVVVSEIVAGEYWPGRRAVGQVLVYHGRPFSVVGVVRDARYMSLDSDPEGEIYWPNAASPRPELGSVLIRFTGPGRAPLEATVLAVVRNCPQCWLGSAEMLADALSTSIQPREFSAWLFSTFGLAALAVAGVGVLGLVAMTTARRTREIGIRIALGATVHDVVRQMVREQIAAVTAGLAAGGLIAAWLVRFVSSYLYKTPLADPWSWLAAGASIVAVAAVGAWIPSRRASRIDPVRALRVE